MPDKNVQRMSGMEIMLESEQLNKVYGLGEHHQQHVLKNINLKIIKGEFVSVMGPSGSGKSTLLYNLSGMDRCTNGKVLFRGREISRLSEKELSDVRLFQMGFIFQQIHLLKNLSIFDNIILAAYLAKKESRHDIHKRAKDLMKKTGIYGLAKHDITQASGGQLQRAAICRALLNQPDIIFGDEPTGALKTSWKY
jgi:putative ABC transport system ATP-binding protein